MQTLTPSALPPRTKSAGLAALIPFVKPYRWHAMGALVLLVCAAFTTLIFPAALRELIDGGIANINNPNAGGHDALAGYFAALLGVALALAVFSSARFYMVSWLG